MWTWLPGVLISIAAGAVSGALSYWRASTIATDVIEARIIRLTRSMSEGARVLRDEQLIVNHMCEVALKSILERLDTGDKDCAICQHRLSEQAASISLVRELLEKAKLLEK